MTNISFSFRSKPDGADELLDSGLSSLLVAAWYCVSYTFLFTRLPFWLFGFILDGYCCNSGQARQVAAENSKKTELGLSFLVPLGLRFRQPDTSHGYPFRSSEIRSKQNLLSLETQSPERSTSTANRRDPLIREGLHH